MNGTEDITALLDALADAERARDEASARCDEIIRQHQSAFQHQMRNIFAMVRSIGRRTVGETETADDFFALFEGRLSAYSRAQLMAFRMGEIGVDLESIVRDELLEFGPPSDARISISGPNINLRGKAAELAPLVFHELACNLLTTNAFDSGDVSLTIQWELAGGESAGLVLTWAEDWRTTQAVPERAQSCEWIFDAVSHQLGGEVSQQLTAQGNEYTFRLGSSHFDLA